MLIDTFSKCHTAVIYFNSKEGIEFLNQLYFKIHHIPVFYSKLITQENIKDTTINFYASSNFTDIYTCIEFLKKFN